VQVRDRPHKWTIFRGNQRMGVERAMHGSPTENDAYEATHAARGLTLQRIDGNGNFSPEMGTPDAATQAPRSLNGEVIPFGSSCGNWTGVSQTGMNGLDPRISVVAIAERGITRGCHSG
jgi:hypothetical protein